MTTDYSFGGSSLNISGLTDLLRRLTVVSQRITAEQRIGLMMKLAQILNKNQIVIGNDDSNEFMGGMSQFINSLCLQIKFLVGKLNFTDTDKDACKELYDALNRIVKAGLPVRVTMEKLNSRFRAVRDNKMRLIIEEELFNADKKKMLDALDALLLHAKNGGNVQTAYQKIIHFCTTDITELTYLYVDRLAYTDHSKLSKKTMTELGKMMKALYENLPKCNLLAEYKVDLAHSCVNLVKHIKTVKTIPTIKEAVVLWTEFINDPDIFDDIKRVYYE